jgi:hypothetical protein
MANEKGLLEQIIYEDFAVWGKAYRDLSSDEWSEIRFLSLERHRAFNWLCGYASSGDWATTPTDT